MSIGETYEINGEKWVVAVDRSTKNTPMFELWECKTGKRMACAIIPVNDGKNVR